MHGQGQIPLGPVPRNFLVAKVTWKSPTNYGLVTRKLGMSGMLPACYEEVTRKSATFRPSQHVQMVWRVANFLVTSRQLVSHVGRVEFGK